MNPPTGAVNRVGNESPKGDGKWGQADLAGNVFEWLLDWRASYVNPCVDCADLDMSTSTATTCINGGSPCREERGGDFIDDLVHLRGADRDYGQVPTNRYYGFGVRCARSP